jgi:hypothetical protein
VYTVQSTLWVDEKHWVEECRANGPVPRDSMSILGVRGKTWLRLGQKEGVHRSEDGDGGRRTPHQSSNGCAELAGKYQQPEEYYCA